MQQESRGRAPKRRQARMLTSAIALGLTACLAAPLAMGAIGTAPAQAKANAKARTPMVPLHGIYVLTVFANTPETAITSDLTLAHRLGANMVSTDVTWSNLQPNSPNAWNASYLTKLDFFMASAKRLGLKVDAVLYTTPCWASSAPATLTRNCNGTQDPSVDRYFPANPANFAAAAAFVANRYRTELAGLELWNEPDLAGNVFTLGTDRPAEYAAMVRATYPAVKAVAPDVPVVIGSLVASSPTFLQTLYADGIKGYYDVLSVHYYLLTLSSIRSIRRVQAAAGDNKPIWLSEFGVTSCAPQAFEGTHPCVTRHNQGLFIQDVFRSLSQAPYVHAMVVYSLRDTRQYDFGLIASTGRPKPAFYAVQRAFTGHAGPARPITLRIHDGVATGSAPIGDVLVLTVFVLGRHVPSYTIVTLQNATGRYRVTLPKATRTGHWFYVLDQPWSHRTAVAQT